MTSPIPFLPLGDWKLYNRLDRPIRIYEKQGETIHIKAEIEVHPDGPYLTKAEYRPFHPMVFGRVPLPGEWQVPVHHVRFAGMQSKDLPPDKKGVGWIVPVGLSLGRCDCFSVNTTIFGDEEDPLTRSNPSWIWVFASFELNNFGESPKLSVF